MVELYPVIVINQCLIYIKESKYLVVIDLIFSYIYDILCTAGDVKNNRQC